MQKHSQISFIIEKKCVKDYENMGYKLHNAYTYGLLIPNVWLSLTVICRRSNVAKRDVEPINADYNSN